MKKVKSQIGIFWGETSLSIVRVDNGKITASVTAPFPVPQTGDPDADAPEHLKKAAFLKEQIGPFAEGISEISLALPTQKLIFRSFHIPFMSSDEIRSVVEFEVAKYVPIPIHELVYTYHAEPFTDRTQKMLRIIFIAIRKTALEEYIQIFQNSGLEIAHIEPASVAAARILRAQRLLTRTETTATVLLSEQDGEIMVFDNDVMQFIRTMNFGTIDSDPQVFRSVLVDNISASFNFFNRQNPQSTISKFLILTDFEVYDISPELFKDINIPTRIINVQSWGLNLNPSNIDNMIAYGMTLQGKTFSTKDFDLSSKSIGIIKSGVLPSVKNIRLFILAGMASACIIAPILTHVITSSLMKYNQDVLSKANVQLGKYEILTSDDISQQTSTMFTKALQYGDAQLKSEISFVLYKIADLMPKGIWLTNLTIQYVNSEAGPADSRSQTNTLPQKKIKILINGKIYLPQVHEQVQFINDFITALDEDPELATLFDRVKRNSITDTKQEDFTITEFNFSCEERPK